MGAQLVTFKERDEFLLIYVGHMFMRLNGGELRSSC